MNSGREKPVEQPFQDWLAKAKRKWSGATITGSGQFAVRLMDGKNIRLFEHFEEAAAFTSLTACRRLTDLAVEPPVHKTDTICGNIKSQSDYEDRQWERKFDRERAQKA